MMNFMWILPGLLSLSDFSYARTINLEQLRLRLTRQVAPPSLPFQPQLPLSMPTNSSDGGSAQTPAPTPPPQPTTPANPAAACSQAANDQTPEAHKYDKLINAFRKCSRSGGNGGQPGAAGPTSAGSSPSGGSPNSSPAVGGPSPPDGFSGSGGSAMNVGGVNAGDQTNVNSSPGGDTSVSNKKGTDGIYTEDNQTSAGKGGLQTSSKKCIAGQFCTESGLGGGRR